jgi:hypothetical protein
VIQITYAGQEGIVVLVTAEAIEIRLPTIEWTMGAYGPTPSSIFWKRMKTPSDEQLADVLDKGLWARSSQFRLCIFCCKAFPPEHMTGKACHGCATEHLGVVY